MTGIERREPPDRLCTAYAARKVKLTVRTLPEDDNVILIESSPEALEFLGQLLLAQAAAPDCGFQLDPHGAGKALFSAASTKGLYIHRLACGADPQTK